MKTPKAIVAFLFLIMLGFPSCGNEPQKPIMSSADARAQEMPPNRIVSMAPSITEIVFALGLGEKVVGVSDFCDYPPEAAKRPKVGGLVNPNVEAVIALEPDLVIALPNATHENTYRSLRQLGIKMLSLPNDTIADLYATVETIGQEAGAEAAAAEMIKGLQEKFAEVGSRVADRPKRRVMFIVGMDPLFVAGKGTFINDLIGIAGGENIAGDSSMKYPQLSIEQVVSKAPEVIFYTSLNFELTGDQEKQAEKVWSAYSTIPAVKEGRIHGLVADHVTLPGPRLRIGIEEMARAIHPEAFPQREQDQ